MWGGQMWTPNGISSVSGCSRQRQKKSVTRIDWNGLAKGYVSQKMSVGDLQGVLIAAKKQNT
jgi:hypothetical protein